MASLLLRCVCFLILILGSQAADLYKVLGVNKDSSQHEIKKAFHKLSLKYHPDKNPSKNAQAKFAEISNAYEILSDDEKRKQYDISGDDSGRQQGAPGGFGGFRGGQRSSGDRTTANHGQSWQFSSGPGGWAQYRTYFTNQEEASQKPSMGWNDIKMPFSFGSSGGGFFDSIFGAAKTFQSYRDSFASFGDNRSDKGSNKRNRLEFSKVVQQLGPAEFQQNVVRRDKEVWMVVFYSPTPSADLERAVSIVNQVAEELPGIVKIGAVNCQANAKVCQEQGISTSSLLKLNVYPYGSLEKSSWIHYTGEWTAKSVKNFIVNQLPQFSTQLDSRKVIQLWTIPSDWPLAVLFTRKKESPAIWRALSGTFHGQVEFFEFHIETSMDLMAAQQFGINSFPAVVGILGNSEDYIHAKDEIFGLSALMKLEELKKFLRTLQQLSKSAGVGRGTHSNVPVLTKATSAWVCGSSTPLCIIGVVDSSAGREKAKEILAQLSRMTLVRSGQSQSTFSVLYSLLDATKQQSFLQSFGVGKKVASTSTELVLLAYKPRKGKFAIFRGPASLEYVEGFVSAVLAGEIPFDAIRKEPFLSL